MTRIHIDRLELRLRGVAPGDARGLAAQVAEAVLRRLSAAPPADGGGDRSIGRIDAGTVQLPAGLTGVHARREASAATARSVAAAVADVGKGGGN